MTSVSALKLVQEPQVALRLVDRPARSGDESFGGRLRRLLSAGRDFALCVDAPVQLC